MMMRMTVAGLAILLMGWLMEVPGIAVAPEEMADLIPVEDYAIYDQVVTSKFLTSDTELVVIERGTRLRLSPDDEGPVTSRTFQAQGYFDDELPSDLVRDLISVNQQPSRLEGRFRFGVAYRFATGNTTEEPEVSLARPVREAGVSPVQVSPVLDRLAFSRVGRSLRNDQALMYVEVVRPDGTGAGFLVWFRRQIGNWTVFDTEVVWTIQTQAEPEEEPLLAP